MTTFSGAFLKHFALVTMVVDHIGVVLLPDVPWLRSIGRLSFIIFCFLLAEGAVHTRNRLKYSVRLLLLALLSIIPFSYAKYGVWLNFEDLNVFFVLSSSVMMLALFDLCKNKPFEYLYKLLIVILFGVVGYLVGFEYNFYGYALVACFYQFRGNQTAVFCAATAATLVALPLFKIVVESCAPINAMIYSVVEGFGLISLIFILSYNGERGKQLPKWFYYLFYPAHLGVLAVIKYFILYLHS